VMFLKGSQPSRPFMGSHHGAVHEGTGRNHAHSDPRRSVLARCKRLPTVQHPLLVYLKQLDGAPDDC
jgi:hypothetical protein